MNIFRLHNLFSIKNFCVAKHKRLLQNMVTNDGNDDACKVERKMQPARGRFARSDLDRQMASTFPCPLESGPSSRFLVVNKSPLLVSYLHSIGDPRHPSPLCPLCLMHDHTSSHLFECKSLPTSLSSLDLWTNPDKVEPFLATWGGETVGCHMIRVLDSAGSTLVEWGRQQQHACKVNINASIITTLYR